MYYKIENNAHWTTRGSCQIPINGFDMGLFLFFINGGGIRMGLQFAYWAPNVSGGLVISKLSQRTGWSFDDNKRYAQIAEDNGFDYVLLQTRFFASYGAENQLEASALASALAASTEKLNIITAVLPGLWHPGVMAKIISTIDHISNGRVSINIVSGWFKGEFNGYGEPWLDHDERYRRSEEFIEVLREMWTKESANYRGDFYRIKQRSIEAETNAASAHFPRR